MPPPAGSTHMQDRKPTSWITPRNILLTVAAAFVLFYSGYQVGKQLALRENAQQAASR